MRNGVGGFVCVIGEEHRLDQIARLAVARAASACAIEFDRERAVTETRDKLEGEFIASLLTASYSSERVALERARRLGADLSREVVVIALRGAASSPSWESRALRAAQNVVARREVRALVAAHEDAVCVVVMPEPDGAVDALYRFAELVRSECARATGDATTSLGLGRIHEGASGVRQSFREAEHALEMSRRLLGPGRQASFADLGLHRLLFAMAQHPELSDYYRDTVGDLVAYDERSSAELMATLDAYFEANGSPTETALRLKLHRNTVLYRLRRIEEVGRLRLDDPATRLNLHLCLRIRDVLQAGAARGAQPEPEGVPGS
jgi:purine catabolism regulator